MFYHLIFYNTESILGLFLSDYFINFILFIYFKFIYPLCFWFAGQRSKQCFISNILFCHLHNFNSQRINHCPHPEEIFFLNFIYLFLAVQGLRFCARAFSSCGERGPLFIAVRGPLTVAASLVVEHRLQTRRLSSCGSRAQPLRGMCVLPRPGHEPVSPALAGGFPTTAPPGKAPEGFLID